MILDVPKKLGQLLIESAIEYNESVIKTYDEMKFDVWKNGHMIQLLQK